MKAGVDRNWLSKQTATFLWSNNVVSEHLVVVVVTDKGPVSVLSSVK